MSESDAARLSGAALMHCACRLEAITHLTRKRHADSMYREEEGEETDARLARDDGFSHPA